MCGRYSQTATVKELKERFHFTVGPPEIGPRYNIAPSQDAPVVIEDNGRRLELFHWGLIPPWAHAPVGLPDSRQGRGERSTTLAPRLKFSTINARAENLMESKIYKRPFENTRCIVVTTGFYEWQVVPGAKKKIPMRIAMKSNEPFAMAGLWEKWKSPEGKEIRSFTIVTTSANKIMEPIHNRMPVILPREAEEVWLDTKGDLQKLLSHLKPYPKDDLTPYEVSKLVNSPANDGPECIVKVAK